MKKWITAIFGRYFKMSNMSFFKGVTIGMAAGAAITAVVIPCKKNKKHAIGKALRTAGEFMENLAGNVWG